jgi:argininosuccinate lyase
MDICNYALQHISVNENILEDEKYKYLFSVESVNKEVLQGLPFRDAYKKVGEAIEKGIYQPEKEVHHTHEGSIGNLCTEQIRDKMEKIVNTFDFQKVDKAINQLLHT